MLTTSSITQLHTLSKPHIYFVPFDGALCAADYKAGLALGWLSDDEIAKVSRYKSESARNNGLQVRLALRAVLSLHSEFKPNEWRFSYGDKGKPALSEGLLAQTGLHFNLSHSGEWLMIGVVMGGHAVKAHCCSDVDMFFGVDIERERSSTDIVPILNHYFTQTETDTLLQLPPSLQRQRFFDLWAVKESYIKARGLGLALSLKSFAVDFSQVTSCNIDLLSFDNQIIIKQSPAIELRQAVKLHFTDAEDVATKITWQTVMGRLDQPYRFAVTLGLANQLLETTTLISDQLGIFDTPSFYQLSLADLLPFLQTN
jgi:4'-phosphopantetheinyl transferase